jgi:hypothetical protein
MAGIWPDPAELRLYWSESGQIRPNSDCIGQNQAKTSQNLVCQNLATAAGHHRILAKIFRILALIDFEI